MNERLRSAIKKAQVTIDDLAGVAEVDPKTVQRWLNGRVPHARHRWAVARHLHEDDSYLWPQSSQHASSTAADEVLNAYGHRAEAPSTVWTDLYQTPRQHIDLLGYAILFLHEQDPHFSHRIRTQADAGCSVRVIVADPECEQLAIRDREEDLVGGLVARVRNSLKFFHPVQDHPNVSIRLQRAPMYNSTFRFDNEMIVTPHLYRVPGYQAPMLRLHRVHEDGMFTSFLNNFEAIWKETIPYIRSEAS